MPRDGCSGTLVGMTDAARPRPTLRAHATILGWLVLAGVLVAVLWGISPDHNPNGQCEGIGFGCTPTPRDSVLLVAAVVGLPLGLGTAIFALVLVGVAQGRRWFPSLGPVALGTVATGIGVVGALVLAVIVVGLGSAA